MYKLRSTLFGLALALGLASLQEAGAAPSIGLVTFNSNGGDFVVVSTNNPPNPWTYNGSLGVWSSADTNDCTTPFRSSRLNGPTLTVATAGTVTFRFNHRYSFEADTTRWDGGQLRLSVNGGPYVTVPSANFTANGYNNTVGGASVPNCELANQFAFTAESAGYNTATYLASVARLGTFNAGDTISVQFLAAWDDCSQGQVPNWEIDSVEYVPALEDRRPIPVFTDPTLPANAAVVEGTAHTLKVTVTGQTSLQWFRNSAPIPGANGTTYTITNMSPADVGQYQVQAANSIGTASSRIATVTLVPDTQPPVLLYAFSDTVDLARFTFITDEPLCLNELECGSDADDAFNYLIESADKTEVLEVRLATVTDGTNVTLQTLVARTPGVSYRITLDSGLSIGDLYGNRIVLNTSGSSIAVQEPALYQQGLNGFAGTHDTELRGAAPGVVQANNTFVTVDTADAGGISQGLLRFDSVIGSGPGQVPPGSIVLQARLTLTHGNGATPDGDLVNVHRMLVPWDESTATYNSFINGVSADGLEARTTPDFTINSAGLVQGNKLTFDVTTSIQAWVGGELNYGWVFLPTGGNGYRWDTSESTVPDSQPRLEIIYSVPPCSAVSIVQQPAASTTVNERSGFSLSVTASSQGCPATYQWTRNGNNIPNATNSFYTVTLANPATDGGEYRVRVANSLPSSVTSSPAQVTVIPDTTKPAVLSATSEATLTAITVVYTEAVAATAEAGSSYSLVLVGGAPVSFTVARLSPTTIRLTTPTLTFGATYNLSISGVTDLAQTPNAINPVTVPIVIRSRRLLASDAVWKYEQSANFDSTLAPGETPWHSPAFNDSSWSTGQGMFGLEQPDVIAAIPLPNPLIRTPWTTNATQLTYYLRTAINVLAGPANSILVLRHATDDGMVAYVDGIEAARYNMTNAQPVLHDHLAPGAAPEGVVVCSRISVPAGSHTLAIEVHQSAPTSSDVVFGAELLQVIPPAIQIQPAGNGSAVLTWPTDPGWFLVQAPDVTGPFTTVAGNPSSGFTVSSPVGNIFYRLQCR
jgi:hypothetical protein